MKTTAANSSNNNNTVKNTYGNENSFKMLGRSTISTCTRILFYATGNMIVIYGSYVSKVY